MTQKRLKRNLLAVLLVFRFFDSITLKTSGCPKTLFAATIFGKVLNS